MAASTHVERLGYPIFAGQETPLHDEIGLVCVLPHKQGL